MHEERAVGRHGFEDPGRRPCPHDGVERQHPAVEFRVDGIAELDGQGAIATGKNPRCLHDGPLEDAGTPDCPISYRTASFNRDARIDGMRDAHVRSMAAGLPDAKLAHGLPRPPRSWYAGPSLEAFP